MSWICKKCETENPDSMDVCEVCDTPRYQDNIYLLKAHEELKNKFAKALNGLEEKLKKEQDLREQLGLSPYSYFDNELLSNPTPDNLYKRGCWLADHPLLVERNKAKVFLYFKKAAEMGHKEAQKRLAACYANGFGIG